MITEKEKSEFYKAFKVHFEVRETRLKREKELFSVLEEPTEEQLKKQQKFVKAVFNDLDK